MTHPARLLAASLLSFVLAGALAPLVVIGLLGLLLFPIGLVLFALALRAGRADGGTEATWGAKLVAWMGAVLVAVAAFQGGSLAYAVVIHRIHPGASAPVASVLDWLAGLLIGLVGAVLLSITLPETGFPPARRARWLGAATGVFPASVLLFFLFSGWWPVSA